MKKKITWLLTPTVFLLLIFSFSIWDFFKPDKSFSESENRYLEQKPKFTSETLLNGEYASKYEEYITDQFLLRDEFIKVKTAADFAVLKRENKGVYIGKDGYLLEALTENSVDKRILENNLDRIAQFLSENKNAYFMPVPTSAEIIEDKLPSFAPSINQFEAVQIGGEQFIDVFSLLKENAGSEVYYKTDHHWTTRGAYYGYAAICGALDISPRPIEDYYVNSVTDDFYGTLYTKAPLVGIKPDKIEKFTLDESADYSVIYDLGERESSSLYDESYLEKRDKYGYFLSGNNGGVLIKSENKNGRRLLLIKDSFAHCMAPFLADEFSETHLLDLRYFNGSVKKYIEEYGITDIVAVYNFSTLQSDTKILNITR